MAIPESQLDTWAKQGSVTQSANTYAAVKNVLDDAASPYFSKTFQSFLQGSYGNNTNIYRDSDVDVVVSLDSAFYHDANLLPADQYQAFQNANPGSATYGLPEFKAQVTAWLKQKFGTGVREGTKAIFIPGSGSRRECDVLVAANFKYYYSFTSATDEHLTEGICFFLRDGTRIVNFPKQHAANCTTKHAATSEWFKPTVRLFKNMRNHLVDKGALQDGIAPSYFIEGLLYNVPADKFGTNYAVTFTSALSYLMNADRSAFKCANGIHWLLLDGTHTSWPSANCQTYLGALLNLWSNWR